MNGNGSLTVGVHASNRAQMIDLLRKCGFDAQVAPTPDSAANPADVIIYHADQRATVIELGNRLVFTGGQLHITDPGGATIVLDIPPADARPRPAFDQLAETLDALASRLRSDVRNALGTYRDGAVWVPTGHPDRDLSVWTAPFEGVAASNEPPDPPAEPVALTPPDMPEGVRIIEPPDVWTPLFNEQAIAVCGGIPGVKPWHDPCATMIAERYVETAAYNSGQRLAILIPRRRDVVRADDGTVWVGDEQWTPQLQDEQVGWEWDHVRSGTALFWYPQSDPRFVMPTTMLELGLAWRRTPIAVGAHPGYARRDILEHATPRMGLELFDTLPDTVDQAVRNLNTDVH